MSRTSRQRRSARLSHSRTASRGVLVAATLFPQVSGLFVRGVIFFQVFLSSPPLSAPVTRIALGCTVVALLGGLYSFKKGKQEWSQNFQRARVFFQFGVVAALVGSAFLDSKADAPHKVDQNPNKN